jgi:hypothetical protein
MATSSANRMGLSNANGLDRGEGPTFDPLQQADMSGAEANRPRRPDTHGSQWLRHFACVTH